MDWKTVASHVSHYAPAVAAALGGPAGIAAGTIANVARALGAKPEPAEVMRALNRDPEAAAKLRDIEAKERIAVEAFASRVALGNLAARNADLAQVNETMRVETTAAETWYQKGWRPFWGFATGAAFAAVALLACVLAALAVFRGDAAAMRLIPELITAMTTLFAIPGAILGVSAWHRGAAKREAAKSA